MQKLFASQNFPRLAGQRQISFSSWVFGQLPQVSEYSVPLLNRLLQNLHGEEQKLEQRQLRILLK